MTDHEDKLLVFEALQLLCDDQVEMGNDLFRDISVKVDDRLQELRKVKPDSGGWAEPVGETPEYQVHGRQLASGEIKLELAPEIPKSTREPTLAEVREFVEKRIGHFVAMQYQKPVHADEYADRLTLLRAIQTFLNSKEKP